MLYPGIDQHARQITISLRNDGGDVVLARQVCRNEDGEQIESLKRSDLVRRESRRGVEMVEAAGGADRLRHHDGEIECRNKLGVLFGYYHRKAAQPKGLIAQSVNRVEGATGSEIQALFYLAGLFATVFIVVLG